MKDMNGSMFHKHILESTLLQTLKSRSYKLINYISRCSSRLHHFH